MLIRGEWWRCSDGELRPVVPIDVVGAGATPFHRRFLVDIGADRTVFSAALLADLGLQGDVPPVDQNFQGIGGTSPFVVITTVLEFVREGGGIARVRGQFAAFTDSQSTDMSILGRDVLDQFDVIVSRRKNEVLLLAPNHSYAISGS